MVSTGCTMGMWFGGRGVLSAVDGAEVNYYTGQSVQEL